jgi:oxygen-independent coproporphyrinogen-3 oxidase
MSGLYIHLPFCARICAYCDFHPRKFDAALAAPLWQSMSRQLRRLPVMFGLKELDSVYLGGGAPNIWPGERLKALLAAIAQTFKLSPEAEVSLEANPAGLSRGKLEKLRQGGFNRLSLGVQSFDERQLKLLERAAQPQQAIKTVAWARAAGFENLNLDIIYALPGQTLAQAAHDVEQALALAPEHLSLYQLTLSPDTRLGQKYFPHKFPMPGEDDILAMEENAAQLCAQAGLVQYEVSNFSRPGRQCRHNAATWRGDDYLALGAGAHGHVQGKRFANYYDPSAYIRAWGPGGEGGFEFWEHLSAGQRAGELFMLGMRTTEGTDLRRVSAVLRQNLAQAAAQFAAPINILAKEGWGGLSGPWLRPTPAGLKMADHVAQLFYDCL